MSSPFDTIEDTALTEAELDLDVETLEADAEDTVDEAVDESTSADKPAKAPKEKKPARPPVAEGYVTPVGFAPILTRHLAERNAENKNGPVGRDASGTIDLKVNPVAPQMVYAYIKNNGPGTKNPLPVYTDPEVTGGRTVVLKVEEALAWWDTKDTRIAASKAAKAEKDAAKAEKASKAEETKASESEGEVTEAE